MLLQGNIQILPSPRPATNITDISPSKVTSGAAGQAGRTGGSAVVLHRHTYPVTTFLFAAINGRVVFWVPRRHGGPCRCRHCARSRLHRRSCRRAARPRWRRFVTVGEGPDEPSTSAWATSRMRARAYRCTTTQAGLVLPQSSGHARDRWRRTVAVMVTSDPASARCFPEGRARFRCSGAGARPDRRDGGRMSAAKASHVAGSAPGSEYVGSVVVVLARAAWRCSW